MRKQVTAFEHGIFWLDENNRHHNTNGPAVITITGHMVYCLHGQTYSVRKWLKYVAVRKCKQ